MSAESQTPIRVYTVTNPTLGLEAYVVRQDGMSNYVVTYRDTDAKVNLPTIASFQLLNDACDAADAFVAS